MVHNGIEYADMQADLAEVYDLCFANELRQSATEEKKQKKKSEKVQQTIFGTGLGGGGETRNSIHCWTPRGRMVAASFKQTTARP